MQELLRIANRLGQLEKLAFGDVAITVGDKRLGWDKHKKEFYFEASDFRWGPRQDVVITNPRTGGSMTFSNPREVRDRENEVTHWVLSGGQGVTLTIWND